MGALASCCKAPSDVAEINMESGQGEGKRLVLDDDGEAMQDSDDKARLANVQGQTRRKGIAAESVDNSKVKDYVKPVYPKDEDTCGRIKDVLKSNEKMQVLFGHLDAGQLGDIINAFQTKTARQGDTLIRQGDEGDVLYILAEGSVDVHVNRPNVDGSIPSGNGPKVVTLGSGALFGELALMYSAPRAATVIVACESASLWTLDREPFKMLLAQSTQQHLEMYEGWLKEVDILKSLNHYELAKISECLDSELFDTDEVICTQGEPGDKFFILEDGTCAAYISGAGGEKLVKTYDTRGQYFGERALLKEEPRAATIRATGEGCSVLQITKEDFTSLLGPIQDILKKHVDHYPAYAEFLK